ncbi:hypothetical protein VNO78_04475 [Psophocarpus tetragonolobus]|uniref:Uncharacterized protein n=1 Tax=Psophocarpus tetragonolobus TaxID=3891 RepID=A0AAN9T1X3_PSOTE
MGHVPKAYTWMLLYGFWPSNFVFKCAAVYHCHGWVDEKLVNEHELVVPLELFLCLSLVASSHPLRLCSD